MVHMCTCVSELFGVVGEEAFFFGSGSKSSLSCLGEEEYRE